MTQPATVALGPGSAPLRRELGPVAWSALEVIAFRCICDGDDVLVARVGVRRLADEMGVAKNTAARATQMLLARGLIRRSQRRSASGRFERGLYELALPSDALVVVTAGVDRTSVESTSGRKAAAQPKASRRQGPRTVEQLALLPE